MENLTQRSRRLRLRGNPGVLLMLAASLAFVLMTLCIKQARETVSGAEVVLWRGLLSLPMVLVAARGFGLRIHNRRLFMIRVAFGFAAMLGLAIAARGLSLVDLDLIGKLRPLIIAAAAPWFLGHGERAGRATWLALTVGLSGCVILLAPELALPSAYAVWALASVICSSAAHLTLRGLGPSENPRAVVFWFHAAVAILAAGVILLQGEGLALPPAVVWKPLFGVAVFATAGQLLMTRAYALERAPRVAAAMYVGPLWALLCDLVFFAAWPAANAWIGGAIVVLASLWLVLRADPPPET